MNDLIKKNVYHFAEADDYLIRSKIQELDVARGWDELPNGYSAASILCYRGDNIWLFRFNPDWEYGNQYDMIVFRNYQKYPEIEEFAWAQIDATGGIERLPLEINSN